MGFLSQPSFGYSRCYLHCYINYKTIYGDFVQAVHSSSEQAILDLNAQCVNKLKKHKKKFFDIHADDPKCEYNKSANTWECSARACAGYTLSEDSIIEYASGNSAYAENQCIEGHAGPNSRGRPALNALSLGEQRPLVFELQVKS